MTNLIIKPSKPRNPWVAAARFRQAGKHGAKLGANRRDAQRSLKRELSVLELPRSARGEPPGF